MMRQWRALFIYALGGGTVLHALQQIVARYEDSLTQLAQEAQWRSKLMRQLEVAEDAERLRLAQELHDDVAQRLGALKMQLDLEAMPGKPVGVEVLKDAGGQIAESLASLRALARGLRPELLDELGLVEAVRAHYRVECARAGVPWKIEAPEQRLLLGKDVEVAAFRFLQEALRNALKHGRPQHISVRIAQQPEGLVLSVEDDGVGFDLAEAAQRARQEGRLGLLGMKERIAALGGAVTLESRPGRTFVSARVREVRE